MNGEKISQKKLVGEKAQGTIMATRFWASIVYILNIFGPLVGLLRLVDGEKNPTYELHL